MEELSKEQIKTKDKKKEKKKKKIKDNDNLKKNIERLPSKIDEIKIILLSIVSFFFYFISFRGCEGTQSYCLVTLSPSFFYLIGVYIMICSLITLYIIYEALNNKISKIHLFYYVPLLIYLLYFYDNGSDFKMVFYFLIVSFIILFLIFCLLKYIYANYRIIFISLTLSVIWILIYTYIKITKNCNVWYDGLNGIRFENNPKFDKCKIVHPKRCWINSIDGVFDVSRILNSLSNFNIFLFLFYIICRQQLWTY